MQQIKEIKVNDETKTGQFIKKSLWYVSISRNALIVMITSIIGYNWTSSHSPPFKLSGLYSNHFSVYRVQSKLSIVLIFHLFAGKVEPGMPEITWPPFEIPYHNQTLSFTDVCAELGTGIIVVPLVAVLANVAIAKSFSKYKYIPYCSILQSWKNINALNRRKVYPLINF